ncbi:hypothetical protein [Dermatobacter hominis]|uniref:hypothetical protein n=1 Tax=Dermatobacter hominis TaxID=2884263 RepID=UPI001D10F185|nr:hypothetical protein [Dermatobacter hominis]UDY36406.1 hypothetical protein LH044_02460 [Dermatobacter hominis]
MADTTTRPGTDGDRSTTRLWSAPPGPSGPIAQATELKDLVVAYAKQETVDPLKTLKRYLSFGISGALLIGVGLCFGLLALLRGLQEIELFNDPLEVDGGTWSWAPYAITGVVGAVLAGLFVMKLYRFTQKQGSAR